MISVPAKQETVFFVVFFTLYVSIESSRVPTARVLRKGFGDLHYRSRFSKQSIVLSARTVNADTFYQTWPDPRRIPVEFDSSYTLQELQTIREAMNQIQTDTKSCIRFVTRDTLGLTASTAGNRSDFISVTPLEDAGSLRFGCWSFPGRVSSQNGRGQYVGITRGPHGCATSQREIMKVLVHALGFRMVQNRPDRDRYIRINYENMASEWRIIDPYRKYVDSQVFYRNLPFDYNSITFHSPRKFSKSLMLVVYDTIPPNRFVASEPLLSRWDCVGLSTLYGCNPNACEDPYGDDDIPRRTVQPTTASTPQTPDFEFPWEEEFSHFPTRSTRLLTSTPSNTNQDDFFSSTLASENSPPSTTMNSTHLDIATRICRPTFKVDSAVYSEDGKIYLFSGDYFWTMDYRGDVDQAGVPIMSSFGGRVQPPIYSAWSNGRETFLMDATRQEITVRNQRFLRARASLHPKKAVLNDAFTFNLTTGAVTYFISKGGTEIQMGENGPASNFSSFLVVGLGPKIDAAYTIPILGSQIVGMFARNDFAYVTPCTLDIAVDPSPCFQTLPVGAWPLPFSGLVSYPAGGCRRRIRLRFPKIRKLK